MKNYVAEPQARDAARLLAADPDWVSAAHTEVVVRRTLTVRLRDEPRLLAKARDDIRMASAARGLGWTVAGV